MGPRAVLSLDDPQAVRRAGRELLSLALMDSRNTLLHALAQDGSPATLRRALRAGAYQEHWVGCHLQRQRGEACDPDATRLAGIAPQLPQWLDDAGEPPTPDAVRAYLAQTLEITLDLLAGVEEADTPLHHFRMSLLHEDRLGEDLAARLAPEAPPSRGAREPIGLPAQRWMLGSARDEGGLVPYSERWAHEVAVPEFEIDAQAVNWSQYVEFADDGGYDRRELWSEPGWAWLCAQGRRAPRGVEQLRGGVLVQRGGQGALQRAPAAQPVTGLSRFEAEAWCRWAGRRLPAEAEWELAACSAASRGFVWGDVLEWVAGGARLWPGAGAVPPGALDLPARATNTEGVVAPPSAVLRGASVLTRRRWHHPRSRRFVTPDLDSPCCGFRSCAI